MQFSAKTSETHFLANFHHLVAQRKREKKRTKRKEKKKRELYFLFKENIDN